jgi:two-component system, OmpR family, alkaline phosphatase synthesis response regulator PhoP
MHVSIRKLSSAREKRFHFPRGAQNRINLISSKDKYKSRPIFVAVSLSTPPNNCRNLNLSNTITSVLGKQQHETLEMEGRKLLLIFGQAAGTSFVIVPGWYIGNEKYEGGRLTAVDVELVDQLEQQRIEKIIQRSLAERGLNFRVSFWGASGFSQNAEASDSNSQNGSKRGKILVVDDDPGVRKIVKMYLEKQGYAVQTAANTAQASELLKNKQEALPNLVLLDIMMPGSTGWQLLKDLENDPRASALPVIAISGLEKPTQQNEYDSKMLYDYLVKPFSMEELSRAVRKFSRS